VKELRLRRGSGAATEAAEGVGTEAARSSGGWISARMTAGDPPPEGGPGGKGEGKGRPRGGA